MRKLVFFVEKSPYAGFWEFKTTDFNTISKMNTQTIFYKKEDKTHSFTVYLRLLTKGGRGASAVN